MFTEFYELFVLSIEKEEKLRYNVNVKFCTVAIWAVPSKEK